jgi:enoyl-CoA hydratase/carnithine racemase
MKQERAVKYETIIVDVADHIATITINRPEAMNSFYQANAG